MNYIKSSMLLLAPMLHALVKRSALVVGALVFAATHATAEFGPQQIITTNATDVMDALR